MINQDCFFYKKHFTHANNAPTKPKIKTQKKTGLTPRLLKYSQTTADARRQLATYPSHGEYA